MSENPSTSSDLSLETLSREGLLDQIQNIFRNNDDFSVCVKHTQALLTLIETIQALNADPNSGFEFTLHPQDNPAWPLAIEVRAKNSTDSASVFPVSIKEVPIIYPDDPEKVIQKTYIAIPNNIAIGDSETVKEEYIKYFPKYKEYYFDPTEVIQDLLLLDSDPGFNAQLQYNCLVSLSRLKCYLLFQIDAQKPSIPTDTPSASGPS